MISKIHKKNQKLPEETNQSLNIINNLSNYIVFLISDDMSLGTVTVVGL